MKKISLSTSSKLVKAARRYAENYVDSYINIGLIGSMSNIEDLLDCVVCDLDLSNETSEYFLGNYMVDEEARAELIMISHKYADYEEFLEEVQVMLSNSIIEYIDSIKELV